MTVELEQVEWSDDGAVEDYLTVRLESHAEDQPGDPPLCPIEHRAQGDYPWPATKETVFLARAGGDLVGALHFYLGTEENLDIASADLLVVPRRRGRGVGRALVEEAYRFARAEGRNRLLVEVAEDPDGGGRHRRFAEAAGWRLVLADWQRRLDLTGLDRPRLEHLLADARGRAAGYSLVQWIGPTPDDLLDDAAVLEARMSTDPPFEDLAWEPEPADPARLRLRDEMVVARGMTRYVTAARHDATGTLVGSTSVSRTASDPVGGHQWETIVLADHRGHRLGLLLKLELLRFVEKHEPAMRTIDTWNAASNTHMVAVNDALGYRRVRPWGEWERRLT